MPTQTETLKGTVLAFNISPKGDYESMMLDAEQQAGRKTVQVNFAPHDAERIEDSLSEGDKVELAVEPEKSDRRSHHPLFRLVARGGRNLKRPEGEHRDGGHPAHEARKPKQAGHAVHVSGTVIRLNYARHGEVNGAILENGCFLHLKPEGARAAQLEIGQRIEIDGEEKPGAAHRVVEVEGKPHDNGRRRSEK